MRSLIAISLLILSATAQAEPIEVWECKDLSGDWDSILVIATVEAGRKEGRISVAGVTHVATFRVEGFSRMWHFGSLVNDVLNYTFEIEPNGRGNYFDFSNGTPAEQTMRMKCRQKPAAKAPKGPK